MLNLLTIVCPPAAALLAGGPSHAAANVGLTLLLYVPGVLHARSLVARRKIHLRNQILMRLAERYCA